MFIMAAGMGIGTESESGFVFNAGNMNELLFAKGLGDCVKI